MNRRATRQATGLEVTCRFSAGDAAAFSSVALSTPHLALRAQRDGRPFEEAAGPSLAQLRVWHGESPEQGIHGTGALAGRGGASSPHMDQGAMPTRTCATRPGTR